MTVIKSNRKIKYIVKKKQTKSFDEKKLNDQMKKVFNESKSLNDMVIYAYEEIVKNELGITFDEYINLYC